MPGATGVVAKVADFGTSQHIEGMVAGRKVDNPGMSCPFIFPFLGVKISSIYSVVGTGSDEE